MPVQSITIRVTLRDGTRVEHIKPLYLCEVCKCFAHFGQVTMRSNRRVRLWFCRDHNPDRKEKGK